MMILTFALWRFPDNTLAFSLSSEVILEVELLNITLLPHKHKQIRPKEYES